MPNTTSLTQIQKLYVAFYGRPADPAGQVYWAQQLDTAQGSLQRIIDAFANSVEYAMRFEQLDTETLVSNLYRQAFGRDAEEAGLSYWVGQLQSGAVSIGQLALAILEGAQNQDLAVVEQRLSMAQRFTDAAEQQGLGYGDLQIPAAVALLQAVNQDTPVDTIDLTELWQHFAAFSDPLPYDPDWSPELSPAGFELWFLTQSALSRQGLDTLYSVETLEQVSDNLALNGTNLRDTFALIRPLITDTGTSEEIYARVLDSVIDILNSPPLVESELLSAVILQFQDNDDDPAWTDDEHFDTVGLVEISGGAAIHEVGGDFWL
ncbi:DUF4214 domain-containing protein [Nitrincola alkalilacustris]|uniref:DUF4214 domain-containing protein n=1 Tax=Nitrincola alkalilacustris TaxID=1571224 RepID=UPI0014571DF9|nr:DUF4214 domain-containing protein [Nitrincola alkalilacustris]